VTMAAVAVPSAVAKSTVIGVELDSETVAAQEVLIGLHRRQTLARRVRARQHRPPRLCARARHLVSRATEDIIRPTQAPREVGCLVQKQEQKFRLRLLFQEIDLHQGNFVIGRASACNLTVEDPLVSREHARILVYPDRAELHDMSSRNGTQLNGKPVKGGERLKHGDRIRVGSYEFTFVVDLPLQQAHHRATMRSFKCPKCQAMYPDGATACPECGASIAGEPSEDYRRPGDRTTPVGLELEDSYVQHKAGMLDEVLNMAITMEHWDKASGFLDTKVAGFEKAVVKGRFDPGQLVEISDRCLVVARGTRDGGRIDWVLDTWTRHAVPMPRPLIRTLDEAAYGWYDLEPGLTRYLAALKICEENEEARLSLLARLRGTPSPKP